MKTDLKWMLLLIGCLSVQLSFGQTLKPFVALDGVRLGFMNETYQVVNPPTYYSIYKQRFGYRVKESATRNEGYLSETGKVMIPCKYQELKKWKTQGLFWIRENNLWGLADPKNGKIIFKPQFLRVHTVHQQTAYVTNVKGLKGIIKANGAFLVPVIYKELEDDNKALLLARNQQGEYGYINQQGKIAIPFIYADARQFWNSQHTYVTKDKKHWILIDTAGKKLKDVAYEIPPDPVKDDDTPEIVIKYREILKAYPVLKKDYGFKKYAPNVIRDRQGDFKTENYQGDLQPLMRYFVMDNLHFPRKARRKKVQGKVKLQFIITENGALKHIRVSEGLEYGCNEEAIRLLRAVPAWSPARHHGLVTSMNMVEIAFDYTKYNRKGIRKKTNE
ncbi:hypothetical protein BKI52_36090 [marine bacterium AO1-C]|nr:hypothetical protein BKI52_36090 [marine bacterium AO1-C]